MTAKKGKKLVRKKAGRKRKPLEERVVPFSISVPYFDMVELREAVISNEITLNELMKKVIRLWIKNGKKLE
ncbi:MAG: hypothetical protein LBC74_08755 [Planctomycetaceae bacterium]|jgi:hypothetical protein|nr:hypothetical protein [Planctomycetaceae bacterium]